VRRLIDVRLHNSSQLAGFAKAGDLAFFARRVSGIAYTHMPLLAPEEQMLRDYRSGHRDWRIYADGFLALMAKRRIEALLIPAELDRACLLCSEASPHHCHRRLVVDYLNGKWGGTLAVRHL